MAAETIKQISQGGVVRDIEDATARTLIQSLQNALDFLTNGDTTSAIESFNEIISFLENVEDSSTLSGIIAGIQTSINGKVDKVTGKGLSTNDFTTELMNKLIGIAAGATANQGTVTGIKVNNGNTQEPTDGVVNLEIETGGEDGVGIASAIQTTTSEVSGGNNVVTITLTDGTTYNITIKNGAQGAQGNSGYTGAVGELEVVNNLDDGGETKALSAEMGKDLKIQAFVEKGTFAEAYAKANENNVVFPWLMEDEDSEGNPVTKMIWHVGDLQFVDAVGAEIAGDNSGAFAGIIVTAAKNGILRVYNSNDDYKDLALYVGENPYSFADLLVDANDTYTDETAPERKNVAFGVYETADDASSFSVDNTVVTDIDFGGLTLTSGHLFNSNTTIETIKNLGIKSASSLCTGCSSLTHLRVFGGSINSTVSGDNAILQSCTSLEYVDARGLYLSAFLSSTKCKSSCVFDFRDVCWTFTNTSKPFNLANAAGTLILGPNTDLSVDPNSWWGTWNNTLTNFVYTAVIPPTLTSGGVTETWLNGKVTNIYVPADSVDAYKSAWSTLTSKIKGYTEVNGEIVFGS